MTAALLSEDSRRAVDRLRRAQLWKVADAYNIPYPDNATSVMMVSIIEGAGVDVTRPLPGGDKVMDIVQIKKQDGSVEMVDIPIKKPHATAGKSIDYDSEIQKRIKENETLKDENNSIASQLAEIMGKLDALAKENSALKTANETLKRSKQRHSRQRKEAMKDGEDTP